MEEPDGLVPILLVAGIVFLAIAIVMGAWLVGESTGKVKLLNPPETIWYRHDGKYVKYVREVNP